MLACATSACLTRLPRSGRRSIRGKVEPIVVDVTKEDQINSAVARAGDVNLLINNAGIAKFAGLIAAESLDAAREEMEVNYFGTLMMTRAFASVLKKNGGGALVNILSVASLGNFPVLGSYSATKAALHFLDPGNTGGVGRAGDAGVRGISRTHRNRYGERL